MAIMTGVGPHSAWLNVDGGAFLIEHGSVSQSSQRKSSSFSATIPMDFEGAEETLANLGDNNATITVEARGQTATLITGEIDSAEFDLIGGNINVTGRDKSAKLHDNKTSEKWLNKMPSEIVNDLIGRAGLSGNITASTLKAGKQLQQDFVKLSDNVSFAYVIHKMAEFDNARWWVDPNGTFNYVPIGQAQGSYSIAVNREAVPISSDCMTLRIHRNVQAGKGIAVTVKAWHPKKKQVFSYTSNVEGNGNNLQYNYHIPTLDQDHVKKYAQSQANEKAMHELQVHAVVVGDPSVSAGMGLTLSGSLYFDQTYDIDSVHHEFGMSGYRTSISARNAKQGRSAS